MHQIFSNNFMPHGHCYLWKPWLVGLHAISDGIIFLCYIIMPCLLAHAYTRSRNSLYSQKLYLTFALFILSCGLTHFMELVNIWKSEYIISGALKLFTAAASVYAVIQLKHHAPHFLQYSEKVHGSDKPEVK